MFKMNQGVTVSLTGRMNNATTLSFQRSMNGHVAYQMRGFFSYRETLMNISYYLHFDCTIPLCKKTWDTPNESALKTNMSMPEYAIVAA